MTSAKRPECVTIVSAAYQGVYEGGKWLAFPLDARNLPRGWDGSDIETFEFFRHYEKPVGKGSTPDVALADLVEQWSRLSDNEQLVLIRSQWGLD
jgi:hypothetical protein